MQGRGDMLQEVEDFHDGGTRQKESLPEMGQMIETHSCWMNILKSWREGYGGRRHDNNPYFPFFQDHQNPQNFPSSPYQRPKKDRRLRQDLEDEGGVELMLGRKRLKTL